MDKNIPVVILCGGLGTRLREETEFKPKPMVEIGGKTRETHERMGVPMSMSFPVLKKRRLDKSFRIYILVVCTISVEVL